MVCTARGWGAPAQPPGEARRKACTVTRTPLSVSYRGARLARGARCQSFTHFFFASSVLFIRVYRLFVQTRFATRVAPQLNPQPINTAVSNVHERQRTRTVGSKAQAGKGRAGDHAVERCSRAAALYHHQQRTALRGVSEPLARHAANLIQEHFQVVHLVRRSHVVQVEHPIVKVLLRLLLLLLIVAVP
jgi:hypothetical protein